MDWLLDAKRRYNLSVLNYMVTSNHIHLLVYDNNGRDVIPKSMQLIAARTGQEYNIRKQRKEERGQKRGVRSLYLTNFQFVPGFDEIVSSICDLILVWLSDAPGSG